MQDPNNPYQKKSHRQPVTRTEMQRKLAIYCDDGTRRRADSTGKEGAFVEACRIVKLAVVPVVVPKAKAPERARCQVEAVMGGMQLERDLTMQEWIGYHEAAKRYGRRTVDTTTQTDCAKIAGTFSD